MEILNIYRYSQIPSQYPFDLLLDIDVDAIIAIVLPVKSS